MAIKLGTINNDTVNGTAGWDTLYGLAGNDTLLGGGGRDILSGGAGDDILEGGAGADTLHGGAGADVFKYSTFTDIKGDKIVDFSAEDQIDFSAIAGAKFIGNAQFSGVAGEIRYYSVNYGMYNSSYTTYLSIDTNGDAEEDTSLYFNGPINFTETTSGSKILKAAADQTLNGTAIDETLTGGAGNDTISGLAGNDTLVGGEGDDVLQGGDGNDILTGGLGNDTLTGGNGADTFLFTSPDDFSSNGYGPYQENITDFSSGDQINITFPGASFIGGANFNGVPGQYRFDGYYLSFDFDGDKQSDARILLSGLSSATAHIALEELVPGSNKLTAAPNQTLTGTAANDTLTGGNGYDQLIGNAGNDWLKGGNSDDILDGGDGNDILVGGLGADTMTGGTGNDTFKYNALDELTGDRITDLAMGDQINLSAITGLTFVGLGNDFTGVANQIRFVDGSYWKGLQIDTNGDKSSDYSLTLSNLTIEETTAGSRIFQIAADKVLVGGTANDALAGGNGNDTLTGNAGSDILNGGYGQDILNGGDGADKLVGGLGADWLTGGAGNDIFKYYSLAEIGSYNNPDNITDLAVGDQINLSAISGLTFVGVGNDFSGIANQVRVYHTYGQTWLEIDNNGDKYSDYRLGLSGDLTIEESASGSLIFQVVADQALTGTVANDTLTGGNGNDTLTGNAGDDALTGNYGTDTLNGGDGADTLIGGLGADKLTGGAGNDIFKYNSLAEIGTGAYLGSGVYDQDTITDLAVGDKIDMSAIAGLTFAGVGKQFSGVTNQVRSNGSVVEIDTNGDKLADYTLKLYNTLSLEETAAGSKIFQVVENKTLNGTTANDTLTGGNGNDTLNGNAGDDALTGNYGGDALNGGDGNDVMDGGLGDDVLNGGNGNDTLVGGLGIDKLSGGAGNDIFKYNALAEIGTGTFLLNFGIYDSDTITDLAVGDKIDLSAITGLTFAGVGHYFTGVANQLAIYNEDGINGTNFLVIDTNGDKSADYSLILFGGLTIEETAAGSKIFQVAENKTLNGTTANDALTGGNGNDTLNGNVGNDTLTGGYGDDTLNGGDGGDKLIGGLGADKLIGGAGNDVFKYNSLAELTGDTITDLALGDKIDLSAFTGLTFAGVGNNFTGVANQLRTINGFLEIDANGDKSSDYYLKLPNNNYNIEETAVGSRIFQIAADKTIYGTTANDILTGGNGNDTLNGGAGDDVLMGGRGFDTLNGGAGNDTFKFNSLTDFYGSYLEVIKDFTAGDKIDLSAIDANTLQTGDQAFTFIGNNSFTGVGGELRYYPSRVISGDINGDTYGDMSINISLSGYIPTASDFIL